MRAHRRPARWNHLAAPRKHLSALPLMDPGRDRGFWRKQDRDAIVYNPRAMIRLGSARDEAGRVGPGVAKVEILAK